MYQPRKIESHPDWLDSDGIKIYTISVDNHKVVQLPYIKYLSKVKKAHRVDWSQTAAFVIFHQGASMKYLVLAWWGNDNELFTSVSVEDETGHWITDSERYSFCLYDMEIMWWERNSYIETIDCSHPSLSAYRASRKTL
ncbi:hypothetical protein [Celerinatantimonas sp. MCCC 1A17872]|uniref:hypothetical protein n=1 Tax=Celerinatantimonas sp. MCCC 1A17872 TaxID=3177514 RepID=UPI0038C5C1AB